MLDVTAFKITVDTEIGNKVDPDSISPGNVAGRIKALADLTANYVNTFLSATEQKTYTENDFDGDGYIHTDGDPPSNVNKKLLAVYVNGEPVAPVLYNPTTQTLSGLGGYFGQTDLIIVATFI